jgi:hypothetical protein
MKSCRNWRLLAATTVALSTSAILAQDQGRGFASRTGGESPNDPSYLLASESVQKDLALTDVQKANLRKLQDGQSDRHPFSGGFLGLSPDEIQKRLDEHAKENRERVAKILSPKQTDRLNEINIQVAGVAALSFNDVATKLAMTAEQKTKLQRLSDDARRKLTELNAPLNGRPVPAQNRPAYQQQVNAITAERKSQALALLNAEQLAAFEKLQGEKFDITTIQSVQRSYTRRGRIEAPVQRPAIEQRPKP